MTGKRRACESSDLGRAASDLSPLEDIDEMAPGTPVPDTMGELCVSLCAGLFADGLLAPPSSSAFEETVEFQERQASSERQARDKRETPRVSSAASGRSVVAGQSVCRNNSLETCATPRRRGECRVRLTPWPKNEREWPSRIQSLDWPSGCWPQAVGLRPFRTGIGGVTGAKTGARTSCLPAGLEGQISVCEANQ